ncbi:MAG: hypothetical protein JWP25_438 [Bradyrhizobium sp.]|nr:hypothetical protein [Bradyrhizobium sp.]
MFRVGQEVECITDAWQPGRLKLTMPKARCVYTIRGMTLRPWSDVQRGLWLIGIDNKVSHFIDGTYEPYFDAQYFRPIVERKTDITFAHEILRKASRKDRVRA